VELSDQSSDELLAAWRWLVPSTLSLRMVSSLGDAFLEGPDGAIYWLDVGGAELSRIAESKAAFDRLRQQEEYSSQWFVPQLVGNLLASGKSLAKCQCFSYKIPLTLGGAFEPANFEPCDLSVHFHTLGQIQQQVKHLPVGTSISSVKLGDVP